MLTGIQESLKPWSPETAFNWVLVQGFNFRCRVWVIQKLFLAIDAYLW